MFEKWEMCVCECELPTHSLLMGKRGCQRKADSEKSLPTDIICLRYGSVSIAKKKKKGDWMGFILLEPEESH